ncbi:cytochrome c biogenesis protein ResB [Brachybacterium squillarum]|uniref:cytochrome c biogenesis protein ResB n=1 Tax=Brachybacterium squillarum TaxID=661979 RepID=UPI000262AEA0|nr:cytochrome c biogenesis protein ResB [Brachybacterium squillarum]
MARKNRTDRSPADKAPAENVPAEEPAGEQAPDSQVASDASGETSGRWSSKQAPVSVPALGLRGTLLFLWRQLTSMQTALVLLMLLAVAAVPGSLYPQRSVNPALTEQYLAENGRWGEILDTLGFFEVFSSPWFSAIYLLLFVSLIGCIVPRVMVHARQLRSKPPRTPARLTRFVGHTRVELPGADAEELLAAAQKSLRRSRYRTERREEARGAASVSAERGLLRETGNLLFHVSLVVVLVCIAGGQLTSYRGQITVIEGGGFSNSLTQYDSFESGAWYDSADLPSFQLTLDDFRATYNTTQTPQNFGQPTSFEADVSVVTPDGEPTTQTVEVNRPLRVEGASMYLLGNGYAPEVTLTDPEGNVVAEGPQITVPLGDTGYTSQLVMKAPDAQPEQTAVVGYFLPTGEIDENGPHSVYPDLLDPQVVVTVYQGDLGLDGDELPNAYEVDVSTLEPLTEEGEDTPVLVRLYQGEEITLPDGSTLSFDGVRRYAAFDVAHDPFERWVLIGALTAVAGLIASLFVPRRRVWVRVLPREGGGAVMEVAGLARSDDPSLEDDVHALAARLSAGQDEQTTPTDDPPSAAEDTTPGRDTP